METGLYTSVSLKVTFCVSYWSITYLFSVSISAFDLLL